MRPDNVIAYEFSTTTSLGYIVLRPNWIKAKGEADSLDMDFASLLFRAKLYFRMLNLPKAGNFPAMAVNLLPLNKCRRFEYDIYCTTDGLEYVWGAVVLNATEAPETGAVSRSIIPQFYPFACFFSSAS